MVSEALWGVGKNNRILEKSLRLLWNKNDEY